MLPILYHSLFDYPLTKKELAYWKPGKKLYKDSKKNCADIETDGSFYFLKGKAQTIKKRLKRERFSNEKLEIVKSVVKKLSFVVTIKFVGITGSLAMKNADKGSDIDLLIITSKNTLWTTRLMVYILLAFFGLGVRSAKSKKQKNLLCLNMWMGEDDLKILSKNVYTAHELVQTVPLINKNHTYEKLLVSNSWVKDYWPMAVEVKKLKKTQKDTSIFKMFLYEGLLFFCNQVFIRPIERISFVCQYWYMGSKITSEEISVSRAFFHPQSWEKVVLKKYDQAIKRLQTSLVNS